MDPVLIGFIIYLVLILGVGLWTYKLTKTQEDFIIAGRRLNPWVVAFSERASGESAWLLLGLPGAVFLAGLVEIWTAVGCILGIAFAWFVIAKDLRVKSEEHDALTIPEFFSKNFGVNDNRIRLVATFIIIFFYTFYVSAQFNGAGKTLNVTFGIPHIYGILIGAFVIVFYTLMGGFFAVAWTDFVQAMIMILTLVALPITGLIGLKMLHIPLNITLSSLIGDKTGWAAFAGVIGGLSWGLGYMGQPHLVIRYMSIKDPEQIRISRNIAIVWSIPAFFGAVFIGAVGKALLSPGSLLDAEKLMPILATTFFPRWFAGILISGAIAAMMSTADSQLLVTTSAISEDIYHRAFGRKLSQRTLVGVSRLVTFLVGVFAFILAVVSKKLIFTMVSYAWSGLGASFGPAILLALKWPRTTPDGVLAGMITGAVSTIVWANIPVLNNFLTVRLVSFILATLAVVIVSLLTEKEKTEYK